MKANGTIFFNHIWTRSSFPPNGSKNPYFEYKIHIVRLVDVISLVREVYQSLNILKYKTNSYKKSQLKLKSMLKRIFSTEGNYCFKSFDGI
jgi:hypothetical protein